MPLSALLAPIASSVDVAPVLAYLDPGTGSYALQLILAGAFGGLFALKQSWQQVRARLTQIRSPRRVGTSLFETTD